MKLQDALWDLVVPSSVGVRLTPENRQQFAHSSRLFMQATSAETNVASVISGLGLRAKVLTKFVEGSPVASFIRSDLRARSLDVEGPTIPQGGAWGYRHQFNLADCGFGARGPRVWNDRAGEVGTSMRAQDFDLARIFTQERVKIVHISGLIAALSEKTGKMCIDIVKYAKAHDSIISFDLNYRQSFWDGREDELSTVFREIAAMSDILFGNEEDFQLALGTPGPERGGGNLEPEGFQQMIGRVRNTYPQAKYIATTLRKVLSANRHLWGMMLWRHEETGSSKLKDGQFLFADPREIEVLDRIGGGDASIGGLLYGILRGFSPEECLRFAWGCGALVAGNLTDYLLPADEDQVWNAWSGNARVRR